MPPRPAPPPAPPVARIAARCCSTTMRACRGRVAAEAKFKEIQRAFDALMTTDEEQTIEALTAKGQKDAERAAKVSLFLLISVWAVRLTYVVFCLQRS